MGNKITKTFEEWCVENNKQDVLERWDYELNNKNPSEIGFGARNKCWFKCPKGIHESELFDIPSITKEGNAGNLQCTECNSFQQWCYDNLSKEEADEILSRWDYELNRCKPNETSFASGGKNKKGYWFKCLKHPEHKSELKRLADITSKGRIKINCKQCNSFAQWCADNNRQDILNRWDYELNNKKPDEVFCSSRGKYYFKCPKGIHKSELKYLTVITRNSSTLMICNQCNSFKQWCIENNRQNILDRWDYELNNCDPNEVLAYSNKKYYFKCPRGLHESELKNIGNFTNGQEGSIDCNRCSSFAQWGIDNICPDFLEKYWSDKNTVSSWNIFKASNKKIWIKCQEKEYHDSYEILCSGFYEGCRCNYCSGKKVHPKDSLGQYIVDNYGQDFLDKIWSSKNKKSAYEYMPKSDKKVWWKCFDGKHDDYKRDVNHSNRNSFKCPECQFYNGEKRILEYLKQKNFIKDEDYISQMKFEGLLGVGKYNLSYDFYLPKYNILIEYQGIQHEQPVKLFGGKERFKIQKEHDKRKKEYAENNNIKLLEIWYYDYNNIEEILSNYII